MKKTKALITLILTLIVVVNMPTLILKGQASTQQEISESINKGVAWLAAQQNPDGHWGEYPVGETGLAVLKLETYAADSGKDPLDPSYIYYTNVSKGLDFIFSNAHNVSITTQPAGNPDANNNGWGVEIYTYEEIYETGTSAMAIAASQHPEKIVDVPGSDANGRTYKDVLTDIVDFLAFAQNEATLGSENYRGGWGYYPNSVGWSDNSASGYAVLGLVYAESPAPYGFGLTIPAFVKTELNYWITYIQNHDVTDVDNFGGSGYTDNVTANMLRTGTLLQEMAFVGDTLATQRVKDALNYTGRHWDDLNTDPGWRGDISQAELAYKQAAFTLMKGFVAFQITNITVQRVDGPANVNWYDNMSSVLVSQQNATDGFWAVGGEDDTDNFLSTSWALLVLEKAAPVLAKYTLTVQVKDANTENSISGAEVDVNDGVSLSGFTNQTGFVEFAQLLGGTYTANASATGYQTASETFMLDKNATVIIKLTPILITGIINGTATDTSTTLPIQGATIAANGVSNTTDAEGHYQISIASGTYTVTADKSGYTSASKQATVTAGETTTVNFALEPIPPPPAQGTLNGTVTDASTTLPIEDATVTATGGKSDTTDASGHYEITLDAGTYNVTAEKTGYITQTVKDVVIVAEKTTTQNIALEPVPPPATGIINGTVTDASTTLPIQGASVTANGVFNITDAEGHYQIAIVPGTYSVTADKSGYTSASNPATVTASETTTVNFTLMPIVPEFSVSVSPSSLTIVQGNSGTSTITITSINGFSAEVGLSVTGAPTGVTATLIPTSVTPPIDGTVTSTLTVSANSTAELGSFTLTIHGASESLTHDTTIDLTVTHAGVIEAKIDIRPHTLNLRCKGRWIVCFIELPNGYNVADINASTIMLNSTIPAKLKPTAIGDFDHDGVTELMVKFDRSEVQELILNSTHTKKRFNCVALTVTGYLNDGTQFQGTDRIKTILPPHHHHHHNFHHHDHHNGRNHHCKTGPHT